MTYNPHLIHGDATDPATTVHIPQVDLLFADMPYGTDQTQRSGDVVYLDYSISAATDFMVDVIKNVDLSAAANVVVMCDHRAKWVMKQKIDSQLALNFQSEVVWCYASGGASKKSLPQKFDTILWYSVADGDDVVYNPQREPYRSLRPGETRPGFHPDGKMVSSWWDIPILSTTSSERCGYPSQKPSRLMDRVISMWSDPGFTVLDPCCGSGSTLESARGLGRHSWGVDTSVDAIRIAGERLGIQAV